MRLIRCFSFGKVSNSRAQPETFPAGSSIAPQLIYSQTQLEHSRNTAWAAHGKKCLQFHTHDGIVYTIPSLTVKFIKTPLKALFYLGFSAVPFRFTI